MDEFSQIEDPGKVAAAAALDRPRPQRRRRAQPDAPAWRESPASVAANALQRAGQALEVALIALSYDDDAAHEAKECIERALTASTTP
jgi:hypothetical protein